MKERLKEMFIEIYVERAVKQKELYNSEEEKNEVMTLVDEYAKEHLGFSIYDPQSNKEFEDVYMEALYPIFKEIKEQKIKQN